MMSPADLTPLVLEAVTHPRLPDVIAEQIVEAISSGALNPQDQLPTEHELARQLGVGRTSVREALQKLQALGVIEVVKGRGSFVRWRTADDAGQTFARWSAEHRFVVAELLEARMALESVAAAFAATRVEDSELQQLVERNLAHIAADRSGDLDAAVATDVQFHDVVMAASRNQLLTKLHGVAVAELKDFRRQTLSLPGALARSAEGHTAIINALRAREPAAARRAVIEHLWVLYREVDDAASSLSDRVPSPALALASPEAFV